MIPLLLAALLQTVAADSGEVHLQNIRQLTFGGQNAEAYFSRSGQQIIFQRQEADSGCDQEFVMNTDGTGLHRVSNGKGRATCGRCTITISTSPVPTVRELGASPIIRGMTRKAPCPRTERRSCSRRCGMATSTSTR